MFYKYSPLENSYQQKMLEQMKMQGYWKEEFAVQEKIHGANLSIWTTNGQDFTVAKRTADLKPDEPFFNYKSVMEGHQKSLAILWEELQKDTDALEQVTVYGELYGGNYPHHEVPEHTQAIMVQKGIFYAPDNKFCAFDLMVNGQFLDLDAANTYFKKVGLPYAKTLFRGSIKDCLEYPNDFDSTLPSLLGLPEIKPNMTEGTVIRPVKESHLINGKRIIIKHKNEKWSERKPGIKNLRRETNVPEPVARLQEAILNYSTANRLQNVLSKIGEVGPKDFGRIMSAYCSDVIEDFQKDYSDAFAALEKKERNMVSKHLSSHAIVLIKSELFE